MHRKISVLIIILFLSSLLGQLEIHNLKISMAASVFPEKNYLLQTISSSLKVPIDNLRQDFDRTFSSDWQMVKDEVAIKEGKTYWLVTLQPKTKGRFTVRYKFSNQLGSYSDREYPISVGDRSCARLLVNQSFFYPNICLGDKIMIPIQLEPDNLNNFNYIFSKSSRYMGDAITNYIPPSEILLAHSQTTNNLNYLSYLGKGIDATNQELVKLYAAFSSKNIGKFNLETTVRLPNILQPYALDAGEAIVTPLEIFPAETPLVVLPEREYSCQSAQISLDSPCDPTSYRSFAYPQQKMRSRVGDRLNIEYALLNMLASPTSVDPDSLSAQLQAVDPIIQELPFNLDRQEEGFFDRWLE